MSTQAGHIREGAAATLTSRALTIDKRVLKTPGRTIAIANISTISVGTHVQPRSVLPLVLAILFMTAGIGAIAASADFDTPPAKIGAGLAVLALVLAVIYFRPQDKTHYLLVSTNDGVLSRFTGPRREMLEEVRDILSHKINAADETSTFAVNFETGSIETLPGAQPGVTVSQTAPANGAGSMGAANGPAAVAGSTAASQATNGTKERVAATDTAYAADRTPAVQPANGHHHANGAAHAAPDQYVDFSHFLPAIVEMHRFYARQPNAEHLEQRLHELELLMRAGAPGAHQKARVRELTGEVSQILQAYPSAVQIFHNIAGLMP